MASLFSLKCLIGVFLRLFPFFLLLNKYIPNAFIILCFAWRVQDQFKMGQDQSEENAKYENAPSPSPAKKSQSRKQIIDPVRTKGASRKFARQSVFLPKESENSCCSVFKSVIKWIFTCLFPSWPSKSHMWWYIQAVILLSFIHRQLYELWISAYNDSRGFSFGCHKHLQLVNFAVPLLFTVPIIALLGSRDEEFWLNSETIRTWLLGPIGVLMYMFLQRATIRRYSLNYPMCGDVVYRDSPPYPLYSHYIDHFFDRRSPDIIAETWYLLDI